MTKKTKKSILPPRSIRRMFPQVETVIDAKHAVDVHVKDTDCKSAEPLNPRECALARAAKREFKVDAAVIGLSSSYLIKGKKAIRFNTPDSVQREIVSFDRHSDFQPGVYHLPPKPPSNSFGVKKTSKTLKPSGGTKYGKMAKQRVLHKTAKVRLFQGE